MYNVAILILLLFNNPVSAFGDDDFKQVVEGRPLTLTCSRSSSDNCHFESPLKKIEKKCEIRIKFASKNDEGEWKCLKDGTLKSFHVSVIDDPNGQVLEEVLPGEPLTLTCSSSSTDPPKQCSFKSPKYREYNFEADTQLIDDDMVETIGDHCSITINNVTKEHEGKELEMKSGAFGYDY